MAECGNSRVDLVKLELKRLVSYKGPWGWYHTKPRGWWLGGVGKGSSAGISLNVSPIRPPDYSSTRNLL